MARTILVAVDGSDHAWKALDLAAEHARLHEARLIILHVIPHEVMPEALRAFAEAEHLPYEEELARFHYGRTLGDRLTRTAEERARALGVQDVVARTVEGRPAQEIIGVAADEAVDMIVLGSRGLSEPRALLLGSVSHKVANHATCTCVTVK